MLNEIFKDADGLSLPVPTGTLSGAPLRIGILNVVTVTDEGSVKDLNNMRNGVNPSTGGIGNLPGWASAKTSGSFVLTVAGAVTVGAAVYVKTDKSLTTVATGAFLFGVALEARAGATAGPIHTRLLQPGQVSANA